MPFDIYIHVAEYANQIPIYESSRFAKTVGIFVKLKTL